MCVGGREVKVEQVSQEGQTLDGGCSLFQYWQLCSLQKQLRALKMQAYARLWSCHKKQWSVLFLTSIVFASVTRVLCCVSLLNRHVVVVKQLQVTRIHHSQPSIPTLNYSVYNRSMNIDGRVATVQRRFSFSNSFLPFRHSCIELWDSILELQIVQLSCFWCISFDSSLFYVIQSVFMFLCVFFFL